MCYVFRTPLLPPPPWPIHSRFRRPKQSDLSVTIWPHFRTRFTHTCCQGQTGSLTVRPDTARCYSTTKGEVNRRELQGSLIRGAHRTLYRGESWDKRVTNVNISDLHVSLTPPRGQSLWVQRVNTNHWPSACLMLGHRLQRWPNIKPALDQYECLLVRGCGRWASVGIPRGGRSLTLNPLRARTINRNSQI